MRDAVCDFGGGGDVGSGKSHKTSECAMPSSLPKPGLVTDYLKEAKANSKKVSIVGCGKVTFGGPCGFRTHDTLIKSHGDIFPVFRAFL